MNIQAPPNLSAGKYGRLIGAGINDWGGVSPVTPDHVNPEAPWPQLDALAHTTAAYGKTLVERLAAYPEYCRDLARWQDPALHKHVRRQSDANGFARSDAWTPGSLLQPKMELRSSQYQRPIDSAVARAIDRAIHSRSAFSGFRNSAARSGCANAPSARYRIGAPFIRDATAATSAMKRFTCSLAERSLSSKARRSAAPSRSSNSGNSGVAECLICIAYAHTIPALCRISRITPEAKNPSHLRA